MRTFQGVAGTLLILFGFYLCPPDHSQQMISLPWTMQVAVMIGMVAPGVVGVFMIMHGMLRGRYPEEKQGSSQDGGEKQ